MRHARALTLPELAVSMTLFTLVLMVVFAAGQLARRSREHETTQQQSFRAAMLAVDKIQRELATAKVDDVDPSTGTVYYRQPLLDGQGQPQLSTTGEPVWSTSITMAASGGRLVRTQDSQDRELAQLGRGGLVTFARPPDNFDQLRVTVLASFGEEPNPSNDVSLDLLLRLLNH